MRKKFHLSDSDGKIIIHHDLRSLFCILLQDVALAIHEVDVALQYLENAASGNLSLSNTDMSLPNVRLEEVFLAKEVLTSLESKLVEVLSSGQWQCGQSYSGARICDVISTCGLGIERQLLFTGIFQQVGFTFTQVMMFS